MSAESAAAGGRRSTRTSGPLTRPVPTEPHQAGRRGVAGPRFDGDSSQRDAGRSRPARCQPSALGASPRPSAPALGPRRQPLALGASSALGARARTGPGPDRFDRDPGPGLSHIDSGGRLDRVASLEWRSRLVAQARTALEGAQRDTGRELLPPANPSQRCETRSNVPGASIWDKGQRSERRHRNEVRSPARIAAERLLGGGLRLVLLRLLGGLRLLVHAMNLRSI